MARWDKGRGNQVTLEMVDTDVVAQTDAVKVEVSPQMVLKWQKGRPERGAHRGSSLTPTLPQISIELQITEL